MRALRRLILLLVALAGLAIALVALTSNFYRVPEASLEPTLHCAKPTSGCKEENADRVVVSRYLYDLRDPHRGDIVAHRIPDVGVRLCDRDATLFHRIAAVPGDELRVSAGALFVNGKRVLPLGPNQGGTQKLAITVPKDRYVVVANHPGRSCDPRDWSFLPRSRIIGPVIATYWPLKRISIR